MVPKDILDQIDKAILTGQIVGKAKHAEALDREKEILIGMIDRYAEREAGKVVDHYEGLADD